ncbi:MAG: zf-HC2 domain-containing protein [Syntrophus sp. (in: bacteria)]
MKERKTLKKKRTTDEKDRILGEALSRTLLADEDVVGCRDCFSPEDIAGLVDGGITGVERDQLMAHMARCDDCYRIFTYTKKMIHS